MVFRLSGEVVLIEYSETRLCAGDVACWRAGRVSGHSLHTKAVPRRAFGTRRVQDVIHHPDHDLVTQKNGPARVWCHADGRTR